MLSKTNKKTYTVRLGFDKKHLHKFGGNSWTIINKKDMDINPHLLFVFDLNDTIFDYLNITKLSELPICSYINSDAWVEEQVYKIDKKSHTIQVISASNPTGFILPDEDKYPNPFAEKLISIEALESNTCQKDIDCFLGGSSFVRLLDEPLWIQEAKTIRCQTCNKEMKHVLDIGYENWADERGLLTDEPFFIGEGALYFFYCDSCQELKVVSQSA